MGGKVFYHFSIHYSKWSKKSSQWCMWGKRLPKQIQMSLVQPWQRFGCWRMASFEQEHKESIVWPNMPTIKICHQSSVIKYLFIGQGNSSRKMGMMLKKVSSRQLYSIVSDTGHLVHDDQWYCILAIKPKNNTNKRLENKTAVRLRLRLRLMTMIKLYTFA